MHINSESNSDKIFLTKSAPAYVDIYLNFDNSSLFQTILAVAKILDNADQTVFDDVPVEISPIAMLLSDRISPPDHTFTVKLSANVSELTNTLDLAHEYRMLFLIKYSENGVMIDNYTLTQKFELVEALVGMQLVAKDSELITAELLNQKYAEVIAPGVLFGLDISKGNGEDMFDVSPGEAVSLSGLKHKLSQKNYNVVKANKLPTIGARYDAICITDDGRVEIVTGALNSGLPYVDESDKTAIAYFYLSSAMLSASEIKIIKRRSLSKIHEGFRERVYDLDLSSQADSSNKIFKFNRQSDKVVVHKNSKRVFPTEYIHRTAPLAMHGSQSEIEFNIAPASSDKIMIDFDDLRQNYPDTQDANVIILPSDKPYPWSGSELLFDKATINTVRDGTIVYSWGNSGSVGFLSNLLFTRYSTFSPNAIMSNMGVRLPVNDLHRLTGIIQASAVSKNPHTFMIRLSVANIRQATLLESNTFSAGPRSNFGIKLYDSIPGTRKFTFTHLGVEAEYGSVLLDTSYVFTFVSTGTAVRIFADKTVLASEDALQPQVFHDLANLSEIYLKNDLTPTIYYASYWPEALSDSDIFQTVDALKSNVLI